MKRQKGILNKHSLPVLHSNATRQIKQVDEDTYWMINFWYFLNCIFHPIYLLSIKTQKMNVTDKEWHINIHHDWEQ